MLVEVHGATANMLINMILNAQNSTYNKFQMTIAEILIVYLLSELLAN